MKALVVVAAVISAGFSLGCVSSGAPRRVPEFRRPVEVVVIDASQFERPRLFERWRSRCSHRPKRSGGLYVSQWGRRCDCHSKRGKRHE